MVNGTRAGSDRKGGQMRPRSTSYGTEHEALRHVQMSVTQTTQDDIGGVALR